MYTLAGLSTYFGKPEACEAVLDELIEEFEANAPAPIPTGKLVRLAWVGGRGQEFGVYRTIDDAGGAVTAWHNADDWTRDYREDLPPLEAYSDFIITGRTLGSPVRQRQRIEEFLPEFGAQGILFYGYIGCSFGSVHREIQAEYFHRQGVPGIFLEGSFQVGPASGQILTRVQGVHRDADTVGEAYGTVGHRSVALRLPTGRDADCKNVAVPRFSPRC